MMKGNEILMLKSKSRKLRACTNKKLTTTINKILDKDKELQKMKIYSKETGFTRSSISKSTRDTNGIDSTVIYDNTRSFTPSSHSNTHDKGNRTS